MALCQIYLAKNKLLLENLTKSKLLSPIVIFEK